MGVDCSRISRGYDIRSVNDAALQEHGIGAGRHVLEALADDRLRQNGRGGRAVAGDIVGLGSRFLQQLGAHVFVRIFQFDFLGDGYAIMGDGGRAKLLVQCHVASLGTQGRADRIGYFVNAGLQLAACIFPENELLCHGFLLIRFVTRTAYACSCM